MAKRWYKRPWWWIFNPWLYAIRTERTSDLYVDEVISLGKRLYRLEKQAEGATE